MANSFLNSPFLDLAIGALGKILDEKIMNGEEFITEIDLFVTEQGLEDGEEHSCIIPSWYDLPEQEYKLKKYGLRQ